jgi:hypothetical protein
MMDLFTKRDICAELGAAEQLGAMTSLCRVSTELRRSGRRDGSVSRLAGVHDA